MKRTKNLNTYDQEQRFNWMIGPFLAVLAIGLIVLTIDAICIDDVNSADENTHKGPVPVGVIELSRDSYLLSRKTDATPLGICKGTGDSSSEVGAHETRRIPSLDSTFVKCWGEQNWNFKPAVDNPGFLDGLVTSAQKQVMQIVFGVSLGLSLIYPLLVIFVNSYGATKDRIQERRHRRIKYDAQLARYRAIQASYSKDEIDDLQFDKKLQALVQEGFTLPDEGIFEKT
jgi:hypothetical protein